MRTMLEALGTHDLRLKGGASSRQLTQQHLTRLEQHKKANEAFWPARNTLEQLLQGGLRANYLTKHFLTEAQFSVFQAVLDRPEGKRRLNLQGHPSCGKTFILVRMAVRELLEGPGSQRVLLLSQSRGLQAETAKYASRPLRLWHGGARAGVSGVWECVFVAPQRRVLTCWAGT